MNMKVIFYFCCRDTLAPGGGGDAHEVMAGTGMPSRPGGSAAGQVAGGAATGQPGRLTEEQRKQLAEAEKRAAKATRKAEKQASGFCCILPRIIYGPIVRTTTVQRSAVCAQAILGKTYVCWLLQAKQLAKAVRKEEKAAKRFKHDGHRVNGSSKGERQDSRSPKRRADSPSDRQHKKRHKQDH